MTLEELEARVERLETVIGQAPAGAMVEIRPTLENLRDFYGQYKEWLVEAYVDLKAGKNRRSTK